MKQFAIFNPGRIWWWIWWRIWWWIWWWIWWYLHTSMFVMLRRNVRLKNVRVYGLWLSSESRVYASPKKYQETLIPCKVNSFIRVLLIWRCGDMEKMQCYSKRFFKRETSTNRSFTLTCNFHKLHIATKFIQKHFQCFVVFCQCF